MKSVSYQGKSVAVTGASGYLASALIDALQRAQARRIVRVSRQDLPGVAGTEAIKADVRDEASWGDIVTSVDVIFHLAGNTSVYVAAKDPAESLRSTVLPVTHLIRAAQEKQVRPRVVFASTVTVYGVTENFPVTEDVSPAPVTNYDLHKRFAEDQLELASRQSILDGVSLRLANVYGPSPSLSSSDDRGILNRVTKLALQNADLKIYGDGSYLRDYVFIDDVVRAFLVGGVSGDVVGHRLNVASGKSVPIRDAFLQIVECAGKITGKKVTVEYVPWPEHADPIEFRSFVADVSRFRDLAGWSPSVTLDQGVSRMIEAFCSQGLKAE